MEGATSFQVAGYKAEIEDARKRRQPKFWATPDAISVWKSWGVSRSETEAAAINAILRDAKALTRPAVRDDEDWIPIDEVIRDIWQQFTREMRQDVAHNIPLRQLEQMPRAAVTVIV